LSSRAAASMSRSPSSTKPPGSAQVPSNGSFLRLMSSSLGWSPDFVMMAVSTVHSRRPGVSASFGKWAYLGAVRGHNKPLHLRALR
jgi:hypothetical protein